MTLSNRVIEHMSSKRCLNLKVLKFRYKDSHVPHSLIKKLLVQILYWQNYSFFFPLKVLSFPQQWQLFNHLILGFSFVLVCKKQVIHYVVELELKIHNSVTCKSWLMKLTKWEVSNIQKCPLTGFFFFFFWLNMRMRSEFYTL